MVDYQDVIKVYATSLYETSKENGCEQELFSQVCFLKDMLNDNLLFFKILTSITVTKVERKNIIDQCFQNYLNVYLVNFLKILIDNNRIRYIFKIIEKYRHIYYQNNGIEEAVIISAIQLSEEERQEILIKLEKLINKKIVARYFVDQDIMGGLIVQTDNKLFDMSLKNKLDDIKNLVKHKMI